MNSARPNLRTWLLAQGVVENDVPRYERARTLFVGQGRGPVRPWQVDQAIIREERRGVTPGQLALLKKVGDVLVRFARETSAPSPYERRRALTPREITPGGWPPTAGPAGPGPFVAAGVSPAARGSTGRSWSDYRAASRCTCSAPGSPQVHHGGGRSWFTGLGGVVTFVMVFTVGVLGAGAIMLAALTLTCLLSAMTSHYRCGRCTLRASEVGEEERSALAWARVKWMFAGLLAGAGAIACGLVWLWAMSAT